MSLSDEQVAALMGRRVQIIDPPEERPETLNQTGTVAMIADGKTGVVILDDGSAVTVDVEQLQVV